MKKSHAVKWVIYHEPIDLFLRTANAFAEDIKQRTNGRINIEVYTEKEYSVKFNNYIRLDPIDLLKTDDVQMSQVYTEKLGENRAADFYALDLPFLFRDHDHATKVLEGDLGQDLLTKTLPEKVGVRGLGFTYSGGFRVLASNKEIKCVEDLKGLKLAYKWNPMFADLAYAFGCEPQLIVDNGGKEKKDRLKLVKDYDVVHTTLPRYHVEADSKIHKYVTNTAHSLFLTVIIISENFWNSLTIEDQQHMREAAFNTARLERKWSTQDGDKIANDREEQKKLGIEKFREMPAEEIQKLKDSVKDLYFKYKKFFSTGFVDNIIDS
jgi:TRAP-type transport system periplasmic protein